MLIWDWVTDMKKVHSIAVLLGVLLWVISITGAQA